jgi:hypothetical protein
MGNNVIALHLETCPLLNRIADFFLYSLENLGNGKPVYQSQFPHRCQGVIESKFAIQDAETSAQTG